MSVVSPVAPVAAGQEGQYCFLVEWYDAQASLLRQYHLLYHLLDDTIELYDLKNRRTFLKRCSYPSLALSDLYIGATVTVYSRQLRVLGYGDKVTQAALSVAKGRTLALLKPSSYERWGRVLSALSQGGLKLGRVRTLRLTPQQAQQFFGEQTPSARAQELASGPVLALEVVGAGAADVLLKAVGTQDARATEQQRELADQLQHVHVSSSQRAAESELDFLFRNPALRSTATLTNATLAIIKPHAVAAGIAGDIIDAILADGFDITALESFTLSVSEATEFLEVYRGVVPEFHALVEALAAGPLLACEVRAPPEKLRDAKTGQQQSIVSAFRQLVGPADPEVARHLRPGSLRARFGQNKVRNAVHATDLDEDGILEVQFFFEVLQQSQAAVPSAAPNTANTPIRR